jgi:hypothetical protein
LENISIDILWVQGNPKKKTQITDQAALVPSQVPTNKLISNAAKF